MELEAERCTENFAEKKKADAHRRVKAQAEYVEDFQSAVVAFLAFHPAHAVLADRIEPEREGLQRELEGVRKQKQRLLDLRLLGEIESDTFAGKQTELRSKETRLQTRIESYGRQQSERADLAVKVFELSQSLTSKWLAADIAEKRLLLEIICLNWTLDGVTLVPEIRKPFGVLVKGVLVSSGGLIQSGFYATAFPNRRVALVDRDGDNPPPSTPECNAWNDHRGIIPFNTVPTLHDQQRCDCCQSRDRIGAGLTRTI